MDLHDADDMSVSLSKGKDFKAAWQPFQPDGDLCSFIYEVLSKKHAEPLSNKFAGENSGF